MSSEPFNQIIAFFGSKAALAAAVSAHCPWWKVSRQAVDSWAGIIPPGRAYQIEVITRGRFKASDILQRQRDLRHAA